MTFQIKTEYGNTWEGSEIQHSVKGESVVYNYV